VGGCLVWVAKTLDVDADADASVRAAVELFTLTTTTTTTITITTPTPHELLINLFFSPLAFQAGVHTARRLMACWSCFFFSFLVHQTREFSVLYLSHSISGSSHRAVLGA